MDSEHTAVFIGVDKEPDELMPDIEAGKLFIVSYPFPNIGTVDVFTYDPDEAIKIILEDIGTVDPITIKSRKAVLSDFLRFTSLE